MVRLIGAGLVGGLVLMLWSVVFSAVGPADGPAPASARAAATVESLRARAAHTGFQLPFGPAAASAAPRQVEFQQAAPPAPSFDLRALAKNLGIACAAATVAAVLIAWFGGPRRPFAERVLFGVLLGAMVGLGMGIPGGGWAEFSAHRTAMSLGEVLVGWTLAAMVIAVMLNPKSKRPVA
ncbi:MAG TPA: hypothetical protein VFF69_06465 [Phycisphaerales bacterium]|nr:hypothetical protein [Phycisphaerales bacterium]